MTLCCFVSYVAGKDVGDGAGSAAKGAEDAKERDWDFSRGERVERVEGATHGTSFWILGVLSTAREK